jgi:hypothetical protein
MDASEVLITISLGETNIGENVCLADFRVAIVFQTIFSKGYRHAWEMSAYQSRCPLANEADI